MRVPERTNPDLEDQKRLSGENTHLVRELKGRGVNQVTNGRKGYSRHREQHMKSQNELEQAHLKN